MAWGKKSLTPDQVARQQHLREDRIIARTEKQMTDGVQDPERCGSCGHRFSSAESCFFCRHRKTRQ